MGIFGKSVCPVCGKEVGAMKKSLGKINGANVCSQCYGAILKKGINLCNSSITLEEATNILKQREKEIEAFHADKKIGNYIYFDDTARKFALPQTTMLGKVKDLNIYNYSALIDFELLEDGDAQLTGGVGRAIVGGALMGGVGAIVGATTRKKSKKTCSKLQIKLTLNELNNSTQYITFINAETKKNSMLYKTSYNIAQEIISTLNVICQGISNELNVEEIPSQNEVSAADEILKFKQLMDEGIITSEEFESKKKQLLGL